ncbi:MAG: outer membrane beta-barrel protein [Salinivirgaceae bacterium]|jgi:hypothetical protein|nr:outer membrane beta-barrel protein [Salinivirgaceae bacterium]
MNKIAIIILALVFGLAINAQGQNKFAFGFEVAPHFSFASSNTQRVTNNGVAMGIKYGLRADNFFGENYAFTSGLMISHTQMNLQYQDSILLKTVDDTYELDKEAVVNYYIQYLEIPLGFKFQSREIGYFRVLFEGGFIPAIRLRQKAAVSDADIGKQELTEGITLFSTSYYFEGGMAYSLGASMALKVTAFYSSGMVDITTDKDKRDDRILRNEVGLKLGLFF